MREIRFRAFDKNGNGMFYNVHDGIKFEDGSHYTFDKFLNPNADDIHDWVLMQFTELMDLWEGDIVTFDVSAAMGQPEAKHQRGVVQIKNGVTAFGPWICLYCTNVKKIGNVHDHPQLLHL